MPSQVLLVARLLADKHNRRFPGAFAEDRLSCVFPEIASPAASSLLAKLVERA
jgi:hypothetical protein